MAFKNGLSERLDELRFPSPRSPPSESTFPGYSPLSPSHSNFVSAFSRPSGDVRANLQRRFTTDSSKLSSWNYLNQVGNVGNVTQVPDPIDLLSSVSVLQPLWSIAPNLDTPHRSFNRLHCSYQFSHISLYLSTCC